MHILRKRCVAMQGVDLAGMFHWAKLGVTTFETLRVARGSMLQN